MDGLRHGLEAELFVAQSLREAVSAQLKEALAGYRQP